MGDKSLFEQDDSFADLMKKAKRKSIRRTIVISVFVSMGILILLWALLYIGQYFMYNRMYKDAEETGYYEQLYGANVYPGGTTYDYFFLAGRSNVFAYKEVNHHIINWHTTSTFHTILGTKSILNTSNYNEVNNNTYNNNYKMVKFHLPNVKATQNDLEYLQSLPEFYSVEVALSFNKELTLEGVQKTFPTASWLWVVPKRASEEEPTSNSLLSEEDLSEVSGDAAMGFPVKPNGRFTEGAEQYFRLLQEKKSNEFVDTQNLLRDFEESDIGEIKIAGVILTGTVKDILPFTKVAPVRIVRTGIIIPY